MMRVGPVIAAAATVLLCGCLHSVTIPPLEASIKEACRGEDRLIASGEGLRPTGVAKAPEPGMRSTRVGRSSERSTSSKLSISLLG